MLIALGKRLLGGIVVVFGVSLMMFILARVIPGDPVRLMLGPAASLEQVEAVRRQLGFDGPMISQYLSFIARAVQFDFGQSLFSGASVSTDISITLAATLELVAVSGIITVIFGVGMGIVSAHFRDRLTDNVTRVFSFVSVALPNFTVAIFLLLIFAYWLDLLPFSGRLSSNPTFTVVTGFYLVDSLLAGQFDAFLDAAKHILMPAVALSLAGIAQVARLTRTNMLDCYDRPYIEFARAYGFSERSIALKWALRPASIPILTLIGMQIVTKLGSAFIIETIFLWPGFAKYGVTAMMNKDLNAMIAVVMIISVFFVVVNMLIDLAMVVIDPRTRSGA